MSRENGSVKSLCAGFGFIKPDWPGSKDVFFHSSALMDGLYFHDLEEGQRIEYEVTETERGPAASNVSLEVNE